MAKLAQHCVNPNPKDRPKMSHINQTLEALQHLRDMAVTCGHWPVSPKPGKTINSRNDAMKRKESPIFPNRKT